MSLSYSEFVEAMHIIDAAVAKDPNYLGADPAARICGLLWESDMIGSAEEFEPLWNRFCVEMISGESSPLPALPPAPEPSAPPDPLESALSAFGAPCSVLKREYAPSFIRCHLKPQSGIRVSKVQGLASDLQVALSIVAPPMISPAAGYIALDVPRADRCFAPFKDHIHPATSTHDAPVRIPIGLDMAGKLVEANLSDPDTCHWLVGGCTGSGKSEWLKAAILSLCYRHTPEQVKIALVDPKRVEFVVFRQMPWLYAPVCREVDDAVALMAQLEQEMEDRYCQLEGAKVNNIAAYNARPNCDRPMPRIVCVFDEFADFITSGKAAKEALEGSIKRLGAKARAAGIHLIIGTQRPDASVVTPLIRSNLPGRIGLRVKTEADSGIIFGHNGFNAHQLLGKGDLLTHDGDRFQSLYVGSDLMTAFQERFSTYNPPPIQRAEVAGDASELPQSDREILLAFVRDSGGETTLRDAYRHTPLRHLGKEGVLELCYQLEDDHLLSLSQEGKSVLIVLSEPDSDGRTEPPDSPDSP